MTSRLINTIGLVLGIIGVVFIFLWGPPQPNFEPGISVGLEAANVIDAQGTTVAQRDLKVASDRRQYVIRSYVGLAFIGLGFVFQLWAVWMPQQSLPSPSSATKQ
jgi:drug/metabolite transporter (DMT)-like permease